MYVISHISTKFLIKMLTEHLSDPEEQKDLVLTFVENHQRMKAGVDDVIMGKGK